MPSLIAAGEVQRGEGLARFRPEPVEAIPAPAEKDRVELVATLLSTSSGLSDEVAVKNQTADLQTGGVQSADRQLAGRRCCTHRAGAAGWVFAVLALEHGELPN
jgi:hypothetical protein